jgi:hypothetical protein
MLNMRMKENLRSGLIMASTLAGVLSGTGLAAAQVADDPPGSAFQDQSIREEEGYSPFDQPYRTPRLYVAPPGRAAYGSVPETAPVRHHKVVRHKRSSNEVTRVRR